MIPPQSPWQNGLALAPARDDDEESHRLLHDAEAFPALELPTITTTPTADDPPPAYDDAAAAAPTLHHARPSDPPAPGLPARSSSSGGTARPVPPQRHSSLSRPPEPGQPRTPRTANRVRFELANEAEPAPTTSTPPATPRKPSPRASPRLGFGIGGGGSGGFANGHARRGWARVASDEDEAEDEAADDYDAPGAGAGGVGGGHRRSGSGGQRERLLEGVEAPSVRVAMDGGEGEWEGGREARPKSGLWSACMNMANSIIGAGIIGQPYAFKQAGLLAGTLLLVGLTITVDWTIRLIIINSKMSGADSFQATMEHCYGKGGLIAISLAQLIFAFGGMVAFCVIIGDTIPHVLTAIFPRLPETSVVWLFADRRFIIVVFILGISFPLSLYRDIAKLAKASTLALISMTVILIAVITQGVRVEPERKGSLSGSLIIKSGIFQAIGVISFDHNSLLIYGSLKRPTLDRFARVTHFSTAVSMVACLVMALAGFLTFGDKTKGNVLNNFPSDNVMVNIARFCFGLNMLTTLPLEAFVCREVLLTYFHAASPAFSPARHVLYTTGLVVAATLLALLTCDLGAVFELVGATSACALAYVLPPLCFLKLRRWRWDGAAVAAVACVAFGAAVLVVSVVLAVRKLVRGGGGEEQQC